MLIGDSTKGNTGPLVYPAGFLYVFSALSFLTNGGEYVFLAQIVFVAFYLLLQCLAAFLYRRVGVVSDWLSTCHTARYRMA